MVVVIVVFFTLTNYHPLAKFTRTPHALSFSTFSPGHIKTKRTPKIMRGSPLPFLSLVLSHTFLSTSQIISSHSLFL